MPRRATSAAVAAAPRAWERCLQAAPCVRPRCGRCCRCRRPAPTTCLAGASPPTQTRIHAVVAVWPRAGVGQPRVSTPATLFLATQCHGGRRWARTPLSLSAAAPPLAPPGLPPPSGPASDLIPVLAGLSGRLRVGEGGGRGGAGMAPAPHGRRRRPVDGGHSPAATLGTPDPTTRPAGSGSVRLWASGCLRRVTPLPPCAARGTPAS